MIVDISKVKIFIKPGPTDMRKQINGLAGYYSGGCESQQHNLKDYSYI